MDHRRAKSGVPTINFRGKYRDVARALDRRREADPTLPTEHVDVRLGVARTPVQTNIAPQRAADGKHVGDLARHVEIA